LNATPIIATTFIDAGRPAGFWRYAVEAIYTAGNSDRVYTSVDIGLQNNLVFQEFDGTFTAWTGWARFPTGM
jgi:hypothetical protein